MDNNDLAVQLSKLSLWTHTFIPGLPLSYFNHNLICGNSLIGIGTIKEFQEEFNNIDPSGKLINTEKLIGQAKKPLRNMKNFSDLELDDVQKGHESQRKIESSLKDTKALFDVIIFNRIRNKVNDCDCKIKEWIHKKKNIHNSKELREARLELNNLKIKTLHFPIAFPEVFLRGRPGFDVIVGNPPWKKIKLEKHDFWARYFPGLKGLSQRNREMEYKKLEKNYPHLVQKYKTEYQNLKKFNSFLREVSQIKSSGGDSDLYKFFCWRFWNLVCSKNSFIGVVLTGSVCQSKGSENFRKEIFVKSKMLHITTLVNNSGWVFEDVGGRRIALLCIEKEENCDTNRKKTIHVQGPFKSIQDFKSEKNKDSLIFSSKQICLWTDSASLPSLPKEESLDVFLQLRKSPRLDLNDKKKWTVRPDREMDAKDKDLMDLKSKKCPKGFWPVFRGKSFNIWELDTEETYAYANSENLINWLYTKRIQSSKRKKSIHSEFPNCYITNKETLPCFKPRIAFRDIGSSDSPRTVRASLIPPKAFLVHTAPYFLFSRGDERDEAFLLGVLNSIPFDWYARLFISTNHTSPFLLKTFPIPRPSRDNPLWRKVVKLSGRLASPDKCFSKWAKAVGVNYGLLNKDKKNDMIHELDSVVAHLYGLSEKQLIHIFETFHKNWDYKPRLQSVLKYYKYWQNKLK